jgi:hypothetical protein
MWEYNAGADTMVEQLHSNLMQQEGGLLNQEMRYLVVANDKNSRQSLVCDSDSFVGNLYSIVSKRYQICCK